jgi:hypothetical protein
MRPRKPLMLGEIRQNVAGRKMHRALSASYISSRANELQYVNSHGCPRTQTSSTSCIGSRILINIQFLEVTGTTLTFKRAMERKTATANHDITYESNQEDGIMAIFKAVPDPLNTEGHKQEVREGVDDLGTVNGSIIVLCIRC